MMTGSTPAVRLLNVVFRLNGRLVTAHPFAVIIVAVLFTSFCGLKIMITPTKDDFQYGYTPRNVRALEEMKKYEKFTNGDLMIVRLFATAADDGSMARLDHLSETIRAIENVASEPVLHNVTYREICGPYCTDNIALLQYKNILQLYESQKQNEDQPSNRINLSYPLMNIFDTTLDLTVNFFGVKVKNDTEQLSNNSMTNIDFVKVVAVHFRALKPNWWTNDDASQWQRLMIKQSLRGINESKVNMHSVSFATIQDEIIRTPMAMLPYLSVGFAVLMLFSVATISYSSNRIGEFTVQKIFFALFCCVSPVMATIAGIGIILWCGARFGSLLLLTPFLVLGIGVDDGYLMINEWQLLCADRKKNPQKNDSLQDRITQVLLNIGPSISISSLTNVLAFGIGAFSPVPDIQLFCLSNAVSMFFDLVYTILFLTATLAIGGRYEMCRTAEEISRKQCENECNVWSTADGSVQKKDRSTDDEETSWSLKYSEIIANRFSPVVLILFLLPYWVISIIGVTRATPGLTTEKLFVSDSPLIPVIKLRDRYVRNEHTYVTVLVNDVKGMENSRTIERYKKLVEDFEALPECNGAAFTKFWIRSYEEFLTVSDLNEVTSREDSADSHPTPFSTASILQFLSWPETKHWAGFMKFSADGERMETFSFVVVYHGDRLSEWTEKHRMLAKWRAIVDNYSDISASIFDESSNFIDQLDQLVPSTIQSSMYTVCCAGVICFLFISSTRTVLISLLTVSSIFIGVFGLLSFWDVNIDPISMSIIIVSIGLSVDYPAHLIYHFYHSGTNSETTLPVAKRLAESLSTMGFPVLQCSVSIVIIVYSTLFVKCYLSEVQVKIISLLVVLSVIHTMVIVPVFLCAATSVHSSVCGLASKNSQIKPFSIMKC